MSSFPKAVVNSVARIEVRSGDKVSKMSIGLNWYDVVCIADLQDTPELRCTASALNRSFGPLGRKLKDSSERRCDELRQSR